MKRLFPIITGVSLALIIGLVVFTQLPYPIKKEPLKKGNPQVAGLDIKYGDDNVKKLTKQEFLKQQLKDIIKDKSGTYSVAVLAMEESFLVSVNDDEQFYPASLYKIPISLGVLKNAERETISLTDEITLSENHIVEGSGVLKEDNIEKKYSIIQLLTYLIKQSDNTAQEMLIDKADFSVVYSLMPKDKWITSVEMIKVLEDLYSEKILNEKSTSLLLNLMLDTSFDDRIHAGLPVNTRFAHKIGNWPETGTWHDCGIILDNKNIAVCVMSKGTTFEEFKEVTKDIGVLLSDYFDF